LALDAATIRDYIEDNWSAFVLWCEENTTASDPEEAEKEAERLIKVLSE
jgi:hypothetical protein